MADMKELEPESVPEESSTSHTPTPSVQPTRKAPPPLPPRQPTQDAPPPYSVTAPEPSGLVSEQWRSHDPRSSSTQSLVPSESRRDGRRTLLLIYIHGFMGNEASFQSFPAHVHNLLTMTMAETHVVHTKLYPRYNSRRAIEYARDDFSDWLTPHEGPLIDVVLLGHSMGGLLAVEVAVMPADASGNGLRHRILGTISFDTPFLGMHPGLVVSGIGSLFRPAPAPPGPSQFNKPPSLPPSGTATAASQSQISVATTPDGHWQSESSTPVASLSPSQTNASSSSLNMNDPYYDPPFPNDIHRPQRSGWGKVLHFVNKHSDGLTMATKEYFMSHIEFGGCLADYQGLKNRYAKVRALEDVDEISDRRNARQTTRRVRFLNYYTASTGIPKKPKTVPQPVANEEPGSQSVETGVDNLSLTENTTLDTDGSDGHSTKAGEHLQGPSPVRIQMENLGESSGVQPLEDEPPQMRHIDSMPIQDDEEGEEEDAFFDTKSTHSESAEDPVQEAEPVEKVNSEPPLPPIPAVPEEPKPIDLSVYTDKDDRKIAEKEQKRIMKVYQQAVKDRENAIKDRKKLVEKREKKIRQEQEKKLKAEQKERLKEEKEEEKRKATINPPPREERDKSAPASSSTAPPKPKRDKRFCLLPSDLNGTRDDCWVRVYMEGVDEVGAHCGLFFQGPQYETLVGDVGARVEEWLRDAASRRAILEAL